MRRLTGWKSSAWRNIEGTVFVAPWILGFLIFVTFPLIYSIYMSFHSVKILVTGIVYTPVGTQYYRNILLTNGGMLYNDLIPFLGQALIMIPVIVVFSLIIAILLNQPFLGRTLFRVVFFLPVIFTTGQVIQEFITQGQGTIKFVQQFRLAEYIQLYLPGAWGTPIIEVLNSFVLILWYSGIQILIFIAGRQTIPGSVYEAARIDGADPWGIFWKITLPAMMPFILLNVIYTVVDLFMFPDNPIILRVNIDNYGQSSALAWIYMLIVFAFLSVVFIVFQRISRSTYESR